MTQEPLRTYLNGKVLPAGRRIFTLESIQALASQMGDDALMMRCDTALDSNRQARRIQGRYEIHKSQHSRARGDSVELDAKVGEVLTGMCTVAQGQAVGDDEVARAAKEFIREVAPKGIAPLTRQSFEDQLADGRVLLERFDSDLARHIELLGLTRHRTQLRGLLPRFARELLAERVEPCTFSEVKESDAVARDAFAAVIFQVLANYADNPELRASLLTEYHRQLDLLSRYYRRHRKHVDVDPGTGEVLDASDEDPPSDVPAISESEA
ncbi:hypothetical protein FRC96_09000 [Lujinxingia vulgaris]|uniref:Uncharacterized protein n=1 Tax=Lujinxingia vulgaris TaxID=2600176 RepID=A0A5C6XFF1_9DELT|nr:hypothetical protein [Lujinxingia vulgaris]TXD36847.1 hypothetical protein FRC96_09000 [Lujinxingia vulgaris]